METAAKVLVLGGVLNLAYGFALGVAMARARTTAPEAPRYLVLAHVGPLMQGPMLLALTIALALSTLSPGWEQLAAWSLVAGSAGVAAGDTMHWRSGTADAFATRGPGFSLQSAGAGASSLGLALVLIGVVQGV